MLVQALSCRILLPSSRHYYCSSKTRIFMPMKDRSLEHKIEQLRLKLHNVMYIEYRRCPAPKKNTIIFFY